MKACMVVDRCKTKVVDIPLPEINENEILLRVKVCGVCSGERAGWKMGQALMNRPLGHEPVAIVEKVGSNVQDFSVGDRVTGFTLGACAEYVKTQSKFIVKVPEELDDLEALGEPLSCLMSGADRTPVKLGDTVAVIGMGFMGLGFLQLMRLKGAAKVIAISRSQQSLDNALKFGADEVYKTDEVPDKYIINSGWDFWSKGLPVVVEASGTQEGLSLATDMTRAHGTLSILGYHQHGKRNVNVELWNKKAIDVVNAHERRWNVRIDCMNRAMALIQAGRLDIKSLVTHEFKPEELDTAFAYMENKPKGFIKAVVRF